MEEEEEENTRPRVEVTAASLHEDIYNVDKQGELMNLRRS